MLAMSPHDPAVTIIPAGCRYHVCRHHRTLAVFDTYFAALNYARTA